MSRFELDLAGVRGRWRLAVLCLLVFVVGSAATAAFLHWRHGPTRNIEAEPPAEQPAPRLNYTLSGEVFLQLKDGTVRYAAGASVYLFDSFSTRAEWWRKFAAQERLAAVSKKTQVTALTMAVFRAYLMPGGKTLLGDEHPPSSATCDSFGRFAITNLADGTYVVVATGRAGFNEVVWETTVTVPDEPRILLGPGQALAA